MVRRAGRNGQAPRIVEPDSHVVIHRLLNNIGDELLDTRVLVGFATREERVVSSPSALEAGESRSRAAPPKRCGAPRRAAPTRARCRRAIVDRPTRAPARWASRLPGR